MALYLISYDIAEKDAFEYGPLWDLLKEMGATKILYSEWVLPGDTGNATKIYNSIGPKTRQADRLLVQEVTADARWDKLLVSDEVFTRLLMNARR